MIAVRSALLLAFLLAGSALALAPSAAASPPCMPEDPCPQPPPTVTLPCNKVPDHQPVLEVTEDCKVVVTLDLFACPAEGQATDQVGPVYVRHDTCQPCYYNPCPPPVDEQEDQSMADPFPTCIRECSPVPGEACALRDATHTYAPALEHPLWGYDCTLDAEMTCVDGSDGSKEADVGFVHVRVERCSGGPDPI